MMRRFNRFGLGFVLGALLWLGARALGVDGLPLCASPHLWLPAGLLGGGLALTRGRRLLGIAAAAECAALVLIGYSPLAPRLANAWVRSDPLQPADAVVSLSASVYPNGDLGEHAQQRLLHAYELLRTGAAPELVITRVAPPVPSSLPAVRRQMRLLGLRFPIDEVGPARNTHDEALAVAALARQRGWQRVLLVTEPLHMRRAAAVFTHAGIHVCASPCPPVGYRLSRLRPPLDRLAAFQDWLHEAIGWQIYRWRGWID